MFRRGLLNLKFNKIKSHLIDNTSYHDLINLKTNNGNTQYSERSSIAMVRTTLQALNYSFTEAGSQQPQDFRNICGIGLNIEVKKLDGFTLYFNDTLPSSDTYYIIMFTGKEFKQKESIPPKIIFINGYDLIKPDIYYALEYKKILDEIKDEWCRKSTDSSSKSTDSSSKSTDSSSKSTDSSSKSTTNKANKLKYLSMYVRPTFKTSIKHLLEDQRYTIDIYDNMDLPI